MNGASEVQPQVLKLPIYIYMYTYIYIYLHKHIFDPQCRFFQVRTHCNQISRQDKSQQQDSQKTQADVRNGQIGTYQSHDGDFSYQPFHGTSQMELGMFVHICSEIEYSQRLVARVYGELESERLERNDPVGTWDCGLSGTPPDPTNIWCQFCWTDW